MNIGIKRRPRSLSKQTTEIASVPVTVEFSSNASLSMVKPQAGEYNSMTSLQVQKAIQELGFRVRRSHPYCIIVDGDFRTR